MKRTDLEEGRGFFCVAAKSGAREGLLGVGSVGEVLLVVVEEARSNWEVRSESWLRRRGSWDVIDLAGLVRERESKREIY